MLLQRSGGGRQICVPNLMLKEAVPLATNAGGERGGDHPARACPAKTSYIAPAVHCIRQESLSR